jgi:hypothetical protein
MDERDDARQFQFAKRVVAYGVRGFGYEAAVAICGMQAIADLDFTGEFGG